MQDFWVTCYFEDLTSYCNIWATQFYPSSFFLPFPNLQCNNLNRSAQVDSALEFSAWPCWLFLKVIRGLTWLEIYWGNILPNQLYWVDCSGEECRMKIHVVARAPENRRWLPGALFTSLQRRSWTGRDLGGGISWGKFLKIYFFWSQNLHYVVPH